MSTYNRDYYLRMKRRARASAIEWQTHFGEGGRFDQFSLAEWQGYFTKLAKRYGLTEEFTENGII